MMDGSSVRDGERLRENIKLIRGEMDEIAPGRTVTLLGATKTVSPEIINLAAQEGGLTDIGENRVQELIEKYPFIDRDRLNIHFIGQLQINKVRHLIGKVSLIHSVDSINLAREIDRRSEAAGICTDILVEVNSGQEEAKAGISPAETEEFLGLISEYKCIRVRGLMTIAPICADPEDYKPFFLKTRQLFDSLFRGVDDILSMGMSDSYRQALDCGSNLIRVGSAIFGKRT